MEKKELKEKIKSYRDDYRHINFFKRFINMLIKHIDYSIYKVLIYSQKYKYYKDKYKHSKALNDFLMFIYYGKKYFKYSRLTNCEIYCELGKNIKIFHGGIIINDNAVIGNNVKFHGHNCIGNNGKNNKAPKIGDNVDIGVGSVIIGDISIASNIIIGANSIVTKSFDEDGITIMGNPAIKFEKRKGKK